MRESRTYGSVRAKAEWLSYSTIPAFCSRFDNARGEYARFSPGFPLGVAAPVGAFHVTPGHSRLPRVRRPRPRICLRKGCGRRYVPQCWNQRYCQAPECQRQVRRWQAARRQANRRQDARVKAQHAQAEKVRRQRAKAVRKAVEDPELVPARGHAAEPFFSSVMRSTGLPRIPGELAP
jgi:hypothetical protein